MSSYGPGQIRTGCLVALAGSKVWALCFTRVLMLFGLGLVAVKHNECRNAAGHAAALGVRN